MAFEIVKGDFIRWTVTLYRDDATFNISTGATVQAALRDSADALITGTTVTLNSAMSGADWANSKITVEFGTAITNALTVQDNAILHVRVSDGGEPFSARFYDIKIVPGDM